MDINKSYMKAVKLDNEIRALEKKKIAKIKELKNIKSWLYYHTTGIERQFIEHLNL